MKTLLAATAVLAIYSISPAFAQEAGSQTTVSKSVDQNGVQVQRTDKSVDQDGATIERSKSIKATPDGETRVKRTQKVTDGEGGEIEKSKSYSNDGTHKTVTSSTRKKDADGDEETTRTERTSTPN